MAGDWLKLEIITPDKPELIRMAATLRIDQDAVFGKLFRVWAWADQNSVDGTLLVVTAAFLDRLTSRKGFAAAMREAGWLEGEDGALSFPNFDRHNGATAKSRAESNRRMTKTRELRKCCDNYATEAQQKAQPEKRREEKRRDIPEEPTGEEPTPAPKRAASANTTDEQWIAEIEKMDCYRSVSVRTELGKAQAWASVNHRGCTRKFFTNWLNRALEQHRVIATPTRTQAPQHDPNDTEF